MRVLIACDKFKGSLTAPEVAEAVGRGLPADWDSVVCPIADGGEGFVDAMLAGNPGRRVEVVVRDALGRVCEAEYGISGDDAFIEMSAASGLWRIGEGERDIRGASTSGTGDLICHAVEVSKVQRIFVGIGGSATNDGGAGMAAALGVRFLDASGRELLPCPAGLDKLASIDESARIDLPEIMVACDVDNPLCGERGASAVFGPQKGATLEDVFFLDQVLRKLSRVAGAGDLAAAAGCGAAGGLGFGLMRFAGARLVSGFDLVAEALGLKGRMEKVDLVITGEGSLDGQTLAGKGPGGVARMARDLGVPVVGVAGRVEGEIDRLFDGVFSLEDFGLEKEESMARAGELVTEIIQRKVSVMAEIGRRSGE